MKTSDAEIRMSSIFEEMKEKFKNVNEEKETVKKWPDLKRNQIIYFSLKKKMQLKWNAKCKWKEV